MLKNWRPITLLNQDYKYLAKILANRLKAILPEIISTDQSGFVNNRFIGSNIIRIQNLIEMCKEEEIEGILINIDFEKAFDTIEWDHLLRAMAFFNFPIKFIDWIKCFYTNIETCIINNSNTTKMFQPSRGVRQGCPLSPYLFVITVELLSLWIKQNPYIEGIKSKQGDDYTISQFADDTSMAIINHKNNIRST